MRNRLCSVDSAKDIPTHYGISWDAVCGLHCACTASSRFIREAGEESQLCNFFIG